MVHEYTFVAMNILRVLHQCYSFFLSPDDNKIDFTLISCRNELLIFLLVLYIISQENGELYCKRTVNIH
jgi:hypothetical protein